MPFEDVRRVDEVPQLDFEDEANLLKFVRPSRWVSVNIGSIRLLRINWLTSLLAAIVLWGFAIAALMDPKQVLQDAGEWQSWVTQNFTWLYIGTQNIWAIFLVYLCFSRFGKLRLGKADEKPEFNDLAWFAMLFSCGIGVGIYYWGVSEPISYYRGSGALNKIPMMNDDDRAQMALFVTLFHWGLHGWVVYIVVALALGVVCYRWNMPLTMRSAFYPLLGNLIYSPLGDVIDALSIACTTFGVCTSLGFGVESINAGVNRLDSSIPVNEDWKIGFIWIITVAATGSICLGLKRGIQTLAVVTFGIGLFLMIALLFMDNTWFLLNSFVQSCGHYIQWLIQVGFQCDTWQQLSYEFQGAKDVNLHWGSDGTGLYDAMTKAAIAGNRTAIADATSFYGSHNKKFMDWWTVFYWGWWISWAPFVGMFIAKISRGRTVRQVILGSFAAPTTFSFLWLIIFGSLGIKMQRVAELALATGSSDVVWSSGSVNCANLGYEGNEPTSAAAKALADAGYYALSCRKHGDRIYDILAPYSEVTTFLTVLVVVGVSLYFVTSSDSGSYIDDILAAQGMPNPPVIQKILWAFTEGAVATGLIRAGGSDALGALQAVSICAGLPYTFAICFLCTSLWRAFKIDQRDADIVDAGSWSTSTLDIWDGFQPGPANPEAQPVMHKFGPIQRLADLVTAIFLPFLHVQKAATKLYGAGLPAVGHTLFSAAFFGLWFCLLVSSVTKRVYAWLAWTCFFFFISHLTSLRFEMREKFNIYGNFAEDFFTSLVMYPFVCSQIAFQAEEEEPASKKPLSYVQSTPA